MGMFDYIHYNNEKYQTKDTPDQGMSTYEIRGNELWFKDVEYEWVESEDALFGGHLEEQSHEWKFMSHFDGLIRFYRTLGDDEWEEYKALFMDGKIIKLEKVEE
jgi:hypothetical protein